MTGEITRKPAQTQKTAYLYLVITICLWGSMYVVSKAVMGKIPVLSILFLRYVIASIGLLAILRTRPKEKIEKQDYKYLFFIGFFGYFISVGAQLMGTKWAGASVASLVNSMNPVFIMLFAALILKETLTIRKLVSVAAALLGCWCVLGGGEGGQLLGVVASVSSVLIWSVTSVFVRRITQKYDPIRITAYGIVIAMICSCPVSMVELIHTENVVFDVGSIAGLLFIGVFCTAIPHLLWNKSLCVLEAGTCSMFYPLQPVTSVLLGCLFLGETVTPRFILGAALIVAGVLFGLTGGKKSKNS